MTKSGRYGDVNASEIHARNRVRNLKQSSFPTGKPGKKYLGSSVKKKRMKRRKELSQMRREMAQ